MQTKSLLVTLGILGSSSLALADHGYASSGWRQPTQVVLRDRAPRTTYDHDSFRSPAVASYRDRVRAPAFYREHTTWQPLTSVEQLDARFGRGESFDVRSYDRFGQLRLQNQTGRTFVRQIEVVFADGQRQCVEVNRALDGNAAMINIDLDGDARRIDEVFVDGRSAYGAGFQIYAM